MLNLNTKTYHFPINTNREICCIHKSTDNHNNISVVLLSYLTEEEEIQLEEKRTLTINRKNKDYVITFKNVYCYGKADFTRNSDDYCDVADFDILSHLTFSGVKIPANYDYKNNIIHSDVPRIKFYDTVYAEDVVQWCHGLLGKPERIILFKYGTKVKGAWTKRTRSGTSTPRKGNVLVKRQNFTIRTSNHKPSKIPHFTIKIKKK